MKYCVDVALNLFSEVCLSGNKNYNVIKEMKKELRRVGAINISRGRNSECWRITRLNFFLHYGVETVQ